MSSKTEIVSLDDSTVTHLDFARIDGKISVLETLSAECSALLTKVSLNCSGHHLIDQQSLSKLMPRRKLKSTLLPI